MAYNMGIAQDIQSASHINNTFAFRYVKQLMDDFGMSRVNADWIVSVWCSCYGGKVLGKAYDIQFPFRSKEVDRRYRENSHIRANLMGIFFHMRKAAGEKVLQSLDSVEIRIRPLFFRIDQGILQWLRLQMAASVIHQL
ncbi:hypothetical protein [Murimonas intestini]|nr:hypothetical protein [Murimonas intestini]MCR1841657.1 hypothetical protein [Murimonas intestini]